MTEQLEQTELDLLKERADTMGIEYHPSIGVDKLKAKIQAKLEPEEPKVAVSSKQAQNVRYRTMKKEAHALKRVLVMNQNPAKKEWKGEFIKVSNRAIGTITKYVPFDIETHVETAIYKQLKQRKMARFYNAKNDKGQTVRRYRLVPEFAITDLTPLTVEELKQLAADQVKRGSIDQE